MKFKISDMSKEEFELIHWIHDAFIHYEANRNIVLLEDSLVKLGNLKKFPKATELLYGMLHRHHSGDVHKMSKRLHGRY